MSSMAKIFVVVNLILTIAAFGSAATLLGAQDDYKTALESYKDKYEKFEQAKREEIDALNNDLAAQKNKASQAVAAQTTAETDLQAKKSELAEAKGINTTITAANEKLSSELGALRTVLENYKNWLEKYGNDTKQATEDALNFKNKWEEEVGNRVRLEEEVSKCREETLALAADKADLDKRARNLQFWLDKYRETYGDMTKGPQGSAGRVLQVKGDLVSISVGSNDGVKVGDTYQIRRGATYVGQITITNVYKDQSVGKFDTAFQGSGAPPQSQDVADPGAY